MTSTDTSSDPAKRLKALKKKQREIFDLLAKKEGAALTPEQLAKIERKNDIEKEIDDLESSLIEKCSMSEDSNTTRCEPLVDQTVLIENSAPTVDGITIQESEGQATDGLTINLEKSAKNLRKKLKQIAELEELSASGVRLNSDQQSKLSKKESILAELQKVESTL